MDRTPPKAWIEPYVAPMAPIPTDITPRGGLRLPVACLMCDIYGTLLISGCGDLGTAEQKERPLGQIEVLLQRYGVSEAAEALLERFHGIIRHHHDLSRQTGVDFPEVDVEAVWAQALPFVGPSELRRFAIEFEMVVNPVWPMPHLKELLSFCRKHTIRMGIISNAQFFTPFLFDWLLGRPFDRLGFDPELILFSYRFGVAKPSRTLFETAARRLAKMAVTPETTVYIGNDLQKDILPARSVGFQTVLFAGDARSLRLSGPQSIDIPDFVVTDLRQLLSSLKPTGEPS